MSSERRKNEQEAKQNNPDINHSPHYGGGYARRNLCGPA